MRERVESSGVLARLKNLRPKAVSYQLAGACQLTWQGEDSKRGLGLGD